MTAPIPTPEEMQERAEIDRSARYPVMFLFTSAATWLLVSSVLGLLSTLKLRFPSLWEACPFMGYGRLYPMFLNALVYGWAIQAGIGVMLWLMARLSRSRIQHPTLIVVAACIWNGGVALGVISVWLGAGRSLPLMDFPGWFWPILALSYSLMVVWVFSMAGKKRSQGFYVSELFLIGAAVWFPWVYLTANLFINKYAAPVMGAGVDAWYVSNLIYFWMAPVGIAVAYFIVPKISARPVYSYPLAQFSFWAMAALAGWTGFSRFMGGPFPAWIPSISGTATILILIAILTTVSNLLRTLKGCTKLWEYSPSLRFTVFGMLMLAIYGFLNAIGSTFEFGKNLQFSHFVAGMDVLALLGFFSMTMFGAFYFIVPRITGTEWVSAKGIRAHFWLSTYAVSTLVLFALLSGFAQGEDLKEWDRAFSVSYVNSTPYTLGRCFAWVVIVYANFVFFRQLAQMFCGRGRKSAGPTLLHVEPGSVDSARAIEGIQ